MTEHYLDTLKKIHTLFAPEKYLEIGVRHGKSLGLASPVTHSIGIDPSPEITEPLHKNIIIHSMTSDRFFSGPAAEVICPGSLDLAFIDGMHLFEYALRDFINIEKFCHKKSAILIHDVIPTDMESSERVRKQNFWTGDVWKIILCLKEYRRDLHITLFDSAPSGLAVIQYPDPHSTVLHDNYQPMCKKYIALNFRSFEENKKELFDVMDAEKFNFEDLLHSYIIPK
jgi:hypothetical protein